VRPADATALEALLPHARRWPDPFSGDVAARAAPVADEVRRETLLVELSYRG
jgi:hypothetical protein